MEIVKHSYNWRGKLTKRTRTSEIILHCSATAEGKDYTTDTIHKWHLARKFVGIGYNFVIYRDGSIHQGRPEEMSGAHCTNHNSKSIGICYIGGCAADGRTPKDTRTQAQKAALFALVHELLGKYKLSIDAVHGHREFANKACPSFSAATFKLEYKALYK